MGIIEKAKRELELTGASEDWHLYEPYLKIFASQGHSGGSASCVIPVLHKMLLQEPLSSLTSDPGEWDDRSEMSGSPIWQNNRDYRAFSRDAGETWVLLEADEWEKYWEKKEEGKNE